MTIKNAITSVMVNGRKAPQADIREVYDFLYEREESERHGHLQGIASAVFGQVNAILTKGGHLAFARDERDAFNAWVGLSPVGTKTNVSMKKVDDILATLGV